MLRELKEQVHVSPLEVLVVFDFDGDSTVPVVRRLQGDMPEVRLHRNQLGRGVANAVKAGLSAAQAPHVLVMMGDGSDDTRDVDAMYRQAASGAHVVAGSRYMRSGRHLGGPVLKRMLSWLAGLSLHVVAGIPTHDPTNNFKIYSRRLLDEVPVESRAGFEVALELTVKAHISGLLIAEVPTTWRDRSEGKSRFRLIHWLPHYLRWYVLSMRHRLRLP